MRPYVWLAAAIVTEVVGTTSLKLSNGFDHVAFGVGAVTLYVVSFFCVSMALTEMSVGLVYATWSAVGIVSLAGIGIVFFDEPIDLAAVLGFTFVISGVILLNVFSGAYRPT